MATGDNRANRPGQSAPVNNRVCVAGLIEGDAAAFEQVFHAYQDRIYAYLMRLTRNRSLADDLFQETWMRAAKAASKLTPDSRLAPWLFTIARNQFISHRRWAALDLERLTDLHLWVRGEQATTPMDALCTSEQQRALETALGRVPLKYREVLILIGVEGMSAADAAAILGIETQNVRQRLSRGRAMLRSDELLASHRITAQEHTA